MSAVLDCWAGLSAPHRHRQVLHRPDAPWPNEGSLLPRGAGRSYGDVCLNPQGNLLDSAGLDRFLAFDPEAGVVRCEAGMRLGPLLAWLLPRGWTLPVVPGTRWATVGGCVANDVHGKNHRAAGSFGHHVRALRLRRSDGSEHELVPGDPLLAASIGGLGLTGLVIEVELQLRRGPGFWLAQSAQVLDGIEPAVQALDRASAAQEYAAAWLDLQGAHPGRGLLLAADPAAGSGDADAFARPARVDLGRLPRLPLVAAPSIRAFNALYLALAKRRPAQSRVPALPFLFTLDAVHRWNRLYGRAGLRQYQCVLPPATALAGLRELLAALARSGQTGALAVLKRFGAQAPSGLLSFPREGFTLAMDFPARDAGLQALFDRFDAIVRQAGGALYPAKDARMDAGMFRTSFPQAEAFAAHVDPRFSSGFWRRVWI